MIAQVDELTDDQNARQDHDNILERRTTALQHLFVPGDSELDGTDAHSPRRTDHTSEHPRSDRAKPSKYCLATGLAAH